jgi:dTDP-4-dehydrorhamnose reductase
MSNILITGSNGQLGSELKEHSSNYKYNFFFTSKKDLDIANEFDVSNFLAKNNINSIINCAAYTAVDNAQNDEKNADLINHIAVKNLAKLSQQNNITFVHISTDYVFDGKNYKPYIETDTTNPISVYGETKLLGEKELISLCVKNSIIIRTSWLYSSFGNNFVKTMLKFGNEKNSLDVIFDQVGSPTYAKDLGKAILDILPKIKNNRTEIYHYSNEGVLSWYDFAKEIMKMAKLDCKINPTHSKNFPRPAARPYFSVLDKTKIKKDFDIEIPYWKDSLRECLKKMEAKINVF